MVWQHVTGMVCVLCGGVAACHRYGVCTVWWCGSMSHVWCVYCVVVWQHVTGMVCVLFAVLSVIFNVNFKTLSSLIRSAFVGE